jgi:aldehyde:ferredoxin oxidoreductase
MEVGKRIQTLRQLFNARHGVDMDSFRMHPRAVGEPPLPQGHNRGITLKIDEMVRQYRRSWGWDEKTGYPLPETVTRLGLEKLLEKEAPLG